MLAVQTVTTTIDHEYYGHLYLTRGDGLAVHPQNPSSIIRCQTAILLRPLCLLSAQIWLQPQFSQSLVVLAGGGKLRIRVIDSA